jgi:hypothetical protein
MDVNEYGKVVTKEGKSTNPTRSEFWMGDSNSRVAFDFLLIANHKLAVVHSFYGNIKEQRSEDFIYEIVPIEKVFITTASMMKDAEEFLVEEGCLDPSWNMVVSLLQVIADEVKLITQVAEE